MSEPPTRHVCLMYIDWHNCSISLMREKALASTAIVEDGEFDLASRPHLPRSRPNSFGCGLGDRVYHARRLSKGALY